jgi:hybrid cluster-associated redox disulfide protein
MKGANMAKITKDMTFNEILRAYPDTIKVLRKFNMQCVGCLGAEAESIEYGAVAHGVDLEVLLKDLNEAVPHGDG